ncbi:unnamed protein product [Vitrella brassicaformis CCMP3155]|uniref:Palmitoyltransferase n=2 Tax=Vitrella brassicaformis TaxID=1169539 RepID=A0A0G4GIH0_VITBC|nr:unnamed protein product [Vitrella brassicaformis CCMP3155]|eukprot:CEM29650.1 unnamed protein product [Vitrella brassicaformis CCMP3155]
MILCCGDPEGSTCIDIITRCVCIGVPWAFKSTLKVLFGDKGTEVVDSWMHYLLYKNNPSIQIFYLFIVVGGYFAFVTFGYPYMPGPLISGAHKWGGLVAFAVCLFTFAIASLKDPGIVHRANEKACVSQFPYDGVIFVEGKKCPTCDTLKPARSKHCSMCDVCVVRFDHHCVWIGNCVGEGNHRWFIYFLLTHAFLCVYGSLVGVLILLGQIIERQLFQAVYVDAVTGERFSASYSIVFQYMLANNAILMFVTLLCIIMSAVLVAFTAYHLFLVAANVTTNETFKYRNERRRLELSGERPDQIQNIYDKGVWENFRECFAPQELFRNYHLVAEEKRPTQRGKLKGS